MPKVPMRRSPSRSGMRGSLPYAGALLIAMSLAVSGCMTAGPIVAEPGNCSGYIPDSWRLGVEGADLPTGEVVADWIAFADAQTGKLDTSNGRLTDSLHIIGECERRAALAVKRSRPKFLGCSESAASIMDCQIVL